MCMVISEEVQQTNTPLKTLPILSLVLITSCSWGLPFIGGEKAVNDQVNYVEVSDGDHHVCARRSSDTKVDCWLFDESFDYGQSDPPNIGFQSISSGGLFSCGIDHNERIHCWGGDHPDFIDGGLEPPSTSSARQISVGDSHACAIINEDQVICWGNNDFGQVSAPDRAFEEVSAGWRHSCGLLKTGGLECWGVEEGEM